MVELHRPWLMEIFEVRRVNKVAHLDAIHIKAQSFNRIGALVGVDSLGIRTRGHQINGRINQHLDQLVRCRNTH